MLKRWKKNQPSINHNQTESKKRLQHIFAIGGAVLGLMIGIKYGQFIDQFNGHGLEDSFLEVGGSSVIGAIGGIALAKFMTKENN